MNVREVEFARAYRLTMTSIEPVSFSVPRVKAACFQDDLFPPTRNLWKPTVTAAKWLAGEDGIHVLGLARKSPHVLWLQAHPLLSAVFSSQPFCRCHCWLPQVPRRWEQVVLEAGRLHPGHTETDRLNRGHGESVGSRKLHLSDIHGGLVSDPAVALSQPWSIIWGQCMEVGMVDTNLIGSDDILPLAGEEKSRAVLIVEGNQDGRRHVGHLYVEQLKVLGPVHRDGPLRLFAEPGDDEELSIVGPHDPRALLRHNRPALDQRVRRAMWRVDADLSILTSRGDVATALTPGKGENLVFVALKAVRLCFCVCQVPDLDCVVVRCCGEDSLCCGMELDYRDLVTMCGKGILWLV